MVPISILRYGEYWTIQLKVRLNIYTLAPPRIYVCFKQIYKTKAMHSIVLSNSTKPYFVIGSSNILSFKIHLTINRCIHGTLLLTWFSFDTVMDKLSHTHWSLDEMTYPFPNFNGCTLIFWDCISNTVESQSGYQSGVKLAMKWNTSHQIWYKIVTNGLRDNYANFKSTRLSAYQNIYNSQGHVCRGYVHFILIHLHGKLCSGIPHHLWLDQIKCT